MSKFQEGLQDSLNRRAPKPPPAFTMGVSRSVRRYNSIQSEAYERYLDGYGTGKAILKKNGEVSDEIGQ